MAAPMRLFTIGCQITKRLSLGRNNFCYLRCVPRNKTSFGSDSINISRHVTYSYDRQHDREKRDKRPGKLWSIVFWAAALVVDKDANSKSLDSKKSDSEVDDKHELVLMIKRAKLHEHRQNFEEAEEMYHRALAQLRMYEQDKTWNEDRLVQAKVYIYDCLANMALSLTQFKKSESLFKESMRGLLQQGYAKNDNAVVEISLKLAMIYAMLGRVDDAKDGYEYCISLQEEKIQGSTADVDDDTIALLGLAVDSYSRFLMVQSKFPEALASMKKALSIALRVFGDIHPQIAVLYNDLATVLSLMNDFESAKENVDKAIDIAQETESPDLPSFLCNLGAIYLHQAEFAAAERTCKKAYKMAAKQQNKVAKLQANNCLEELKKKQRESSSSPNK